MKKLKAFRKIKSVYRNVYRQILYVFTAVLFALTTAIPASATTSLGAYPISSGYKQPGSIVTTGGLLWYIETSSTSPYPSHYIASMTTSGVITNYDVSIPVGQTSFSISSITAGSDGNIWFNGMGSGSYAYTGRLNITTGVTTFYINPNNTYGGIGSIISGSDGNLWYYLKSAQAQNYSYLIQVNVVTGATNAVHPFDSNSILTAIASGPDGNIWVTDRYYNRIWVMNTTGAGVASYLIPTINSWPTSIAAGPDGNMWISEMPGGGTSGSGKIAKITTSGVFTEYTLPSGKWIGNLTTGQDGELWGSYTGSKIGRVATNSGAITTYSLPTGFTNFSSAVVGPDGALWFTYYNSTSIGRALITPDFTTTPISSSYRQPQAMTVAGGSLWYVETSPTSPYPNNYIGNMTTSGVITNYTIPYPPGQTSFRVSSLTTGPNGNLWFNGTSNTSVYAGQFNISTGTVTFYVSPEQSYSSPGPIIAGSDGNLWYYLKSAGAQNYSYLMQVNPSTGTTTNTHPFDSNTILMSITNGPDGNLWLTDKYYNRVYEIATSGAGIASYLIPTADSWPTNITSGPDGNLWFSESTSTGNQIAKLTTGGVFTEYTLPTGTYSPSFAVGSDGTLWCTYANSSVKNIGSIATSTGTITTYGPATGVTTNFNSIVFGPDGAIWYATSDSNGLVGRYGY